MWMLQKFSEHQSYGTHVKDYAASNVIIAKFKQVLVNWEIDFTNM